MAKQRDLFGDFDRMRRQMDQLLDDVWGRSGLTSRRGSGFSPRADVYYCGDPPKVVVKVDLAGIELNAVSIEVSGRDLVILGERPVQESEGRVYQQVEITTGPFRRVIELNADVEAEDARATYEDGILRIELPLVSEQQRSRRVPIERSEE